MSELRRLDKPFKRMIFAGGGNIGKGLAAALEGRYQIKIIEKSPLRARMIAETYALMRRLALRSFTEHPVMSLIVTLSGLGRMFAYTEYAAPGIQPFEIAYNLVIYVFGTLGVWRAYKERCSTRRSRPM